MCLWPFLLIKHPGSRNDQRFITHESIHAAQQKELLVIPFYIWYGLDYLRQLAKYRNHRKAYRNIIFEREAYSKESDAEYLQQRKLYDFRKF